MVSKSASSHLRVEDIQSVLTITDSASLFVLLVLCEGYASSSHAGFPARDWLSTSGMLARLQDCEMFFEPSLRPPYSSPFGQTVAESKCIVQDSAFISAR